MLRFGDNTRIDLVGLLDGYSYVELNAPTITLNFDIGIAAPWVQLVYENLPMQYFDSLYKGKEFGLLLPTDDGSSDFYNFKVAQYKFISGNLTVLALVSDGNEYDFERGQGHFEGSSIDSIKDLVKNITVDAPGVVTDDEMIWLRCNQSEKEFVRNTLLHSYIENDDMLIAFLNLDRKLTIKKWSDLKKEPPIVTFDNKQNKVAIDHMTVESSPLTLSNYVYRNFGVDVQSGSEDVYDSTGKDKVVSYHAIDNGNTHPNYYTAISNNLRVLTNISSRVYSLPLATHDILRPMSIVRIKGSIAADDINLRHMDKDFMVIKNVVAIKASGITQQLNLVSTSESVYLPDTAY
jgi:hypothetical protein